MVFSHFVDIVVGHLIKLLTSHNICFIVVSVSCPDFIFGFLNQEHTFPHPHSHLHETS